ncbi:retrovirus-related pol polyprotein from transposon TNT 1-94 [Tanacetum coccineum]
MILRFTDCKLSDQKAGFQGVIWSKGHTVAVSNAERLTRQPLTSSSHDCSFISVLVLWYSKELSTEQAFWLPISNSISEQPVVQTTLVRMEAPSELPKTRSILIFKRKNFLSIMIEYWNILTSQDVMNIVMHADSVPVNVLPVNHKCLVDDNLESERLIQENDYLFKLLLSQDIVHICVNSLVTLTDYAKIEQDYIDGYNENLLLKAELANKKENMVEKKVFNEVQAKLKAKDVSIANLKKHIKSLKGKNEVKKDATPNNAKVITPGMFKLDLEPLSPKELVEHARALRPLDSDLDSSCKYVKRIQEVLVYVTTTCPSLTKPSEKLVAVTPLNKTKKVRFGNDQIAKIIGYAGYQMGNVMISQVYYVEGLGHNLFFVGQFCDSDLEAEAVATTCYTQNQSLIRKRHNKTPYELLHDRKPDLSYLHVFGALCYPTNNSEDLGKLKPSRYGNLHWTRASTHAKSMFDKYFNPPSSVDSLVPAVVAPEPADSTGTPSSTTIDQDAPSLSTSQTPQETQSLVIPFGVEEQFHDIEVVHLDNDPFFGVPIAEPNSKESSSRDVIPTNVHSVNQPPEQLIK